MKRDLDLARQLLQDIESRGTDCSVSVLRSDSKFENEECVRYHLRLLIDAGLLKEVDRTSEGVPCVRLTHQGHELLELTRNDSRWREAKWACQQNSDCLSLTVIQTILSRWALSATDRWRLRRRPLATRRLRSETEYPRQEVPYRVEPYYPVEALEDPGYLADDNVRYVRVRPEWADLTTRRPRLGVDLDGDGKVDLEYDAAEPTYLV